MPILRDYADGLDCEIFKFNSLKKIYKNKKLKRTIKNMQYILEKIETNSDFLL